MAGALTGPGPAAQAAQRTFLAPGSNFNDGTATTGCTLGNGTRLPLRALTSGSRLWRTKDAHSGRGSAAAAATSG